MIKILAKLMGLMLLAYVVLFAFVWQVRDFSYLILHDFLEENPVIERKEEVDAMLNNFESVALKDLDHHYKTVSKIADPAYAKMHQRAKFHLINSCDAYRYIAGNIRIRDVLSRDEFYAASIMDRSKPIYWRIDKRILYKILELRTALAQNGYEKEGFEVRHGYRTPKHNERVGGASKSRHIMGEAVDMVISDVNKDGKYTDEDKQIVLDVLERSVINNQGGIGKYPGTRTVHMDVRGHRARWDDY